MVTTPNQPIMRQPVLIEHPQQHSVGRWLPSSTYYNWQKYQWSLPNTHSSEGCCHSTFSNG